MLLNNLTPELKAHWELHLSSALKDNSDWRKEIQNYTQSKAELPNIKHPAYIHDWLEHPEWREIIEALNG